MSDCYARDLCDPIVMEDIRIASRSEDLPAQRSYTHCSMSARGDDPGASQVEPAPSTTTSSACDN